MKFRGHETFFIRKGWLSKGMKYVRKNAAVFVNKEEKPMDVLGIGANMVKSLRYWMTAVGITEEVKSGKRIQKFTDLGKLIYKHDRYLEEEGTLFLLQYKLASNMENATAWYYFFNKFNMKEFTKEDFVRSLKIYVEMNYQDAMAAERSYSDDFICIVNTYLPRYKVAAKYQSPENNIACPFGELGLVDYVSKEKKIFKKSLADHNEIPPYIALAIIIEQANGQIEISLDELLNKPNSIGKVFNLDIIALIDILRQLERLDELKLIRTAGLDVVTILSDMTAYECIETFYKTLTEIAGGKNE